MEKQEKVVNKIKHSINSGQTTPLGTKPNDECYTSMQDILNEMQYWANLGKFRGKNIICPCDWDITDDEGIYGIRIEYKEKCVETNVYKNVKKVVVKKYDNDPLELLTETVEKDCPELFEYELKEDEIEDFLRNKLTCNFLRTFTQNARTWGIKSITASGYNPATGKGIPFQEVDYSKYDICCTNPPFSLYTEFMKTIVDKIDFIVLAPFLNRVAPNVGLYLMLKKAYLGYGAGIPDMKFNNPTSKNEYKTKVIAVDWITSFSEAQDERNINLENKTSKVNYELYKDEYIVMENMEMKDGTHPIRVPATLVPDDYDGWMFTSIQFLGSWDLRKYEWYGTSFKKYYNSTNPEANPFKAKASDHVCDVNDKRMFHGIVFRKKPNLK